ncbi:hypothetical protein vBKpnPEKp2_032 [Klebsiella phage vB_KpnP_EKp2]|uniref:Uncharacterized protein n=1 Tax=Klebsiella phage vB_KpnP_EKp2 TaxID=3065243 RepID=A0AAX4G5N6_9CAUD|nr:hypothetical protein vBKpnPEKp2_032 [Klebsiella phage vB_KpnP_EKp2]
MRPRLPSSYTMSITSFQVVPQQLGNDRPVWSA